jgi:hypothetical protein
MVKSIAISSIIVMITQAHLSVFRYDPYSPYSGGFASDMLLFTRLIILLLRQPTFVSSPLQGVGVSDLSPLSGRIVSLDSSAILISHSASVKVWILNSSSSCPFYSLPPFDVRILLEQLILSMVPVTGFRNEDFPICLLINKLQLSPVGWPSYVSILFCRDKSPKHNN